MVVSLRFVLGRDDATVVVVIVVALGARVVEVGATCPIYPIYSGPRLRRDVEGPLHPIEWVPRDK